MRCAAWLSLCLACLSGCASIDTMGFATRETTAAPTWRGLPIREGQIIAIEDPAALSFAVTLLAAEYQPFVHAGLIFMEDGQPYVYEAWAIYKPRLSGRPTRNPGGGVRRVSLASFLRRPGIIAIHDAPPGVDVAAVAAFARERLAARTPFDEYFDAGDGRAMYCAEFVARALEAGGARPFAGIATSRNPSIRLVLDWFEVRAARLVVAGELLREAPHAALLSRRLGPAAVEAHFAGRRELYRRFTDGQRLGNVFRWTGLTLRFQPSVRRFLQAAGRGDEDARRLADRLLGPLPSDAYPLRAGGAISD